MVCKLVSASLALIGLAAAIPAVAASGLDCVDSGYSAKDSAAIETFLANFSMSDFQGQSGIEKLVPVLAARAGECAGEHGWSVEAISDSVYYSTATVLSRALARHSPFTPEQVQRLDAALERADKARLRKIFGPMVEAQAGDKPAADPDGQDSIYLGMMLMSSGVPLDEKGGEYAGAVIATRMMREIYAEKFAAR